MMFDTEQPFLLSTLLPPDHPQFAPGSHPARKLSTSASNGEEEATLGFPSLDTDAYMSFAIDGAHKPSGKCTLTCSPDTELLWNVYDPFGVDTAGQPDVYPFPGDDGAANTVQSNWKGFGPGLYDGPDRRSVEVFSASFWGASTPEVETPASLPISDKQVDIYTSSSSPARRSTKQRRKATRSASTKPKRTRKARSSGTKKASTGSTKKYRVPCDDRKCREIFYDMSTKDRHYISCHMHRKKECPGCKKQLSRGDSLTRHLKTKIGAECREVAKENGWVQVERRGKVRWSTRTPRMNRRELVAAHRGSQRK